MSSNVPPASPSKRQLAKLQDGRDRALLERQAEDRQRVQEYRAWLRNGMPRAQLPDVRALPRSPEAWR